MNTDTPMFRQYLELKALSADALLFFRMGDFYELFFDDARVAAEVLELTLTSRNKDQPDPVPMAGVPHHAARGYIRTLIEKGYKVAVADQVEDPKAAKGLVRRELTRIITPGVGIDPDDLSPREMCWVVACVQLKERWGLASLDVSTGDLRLTEPPGLEALVEELSRLSPREALLPKALAQEPSLRAALLGLRITELEDKTLDERAARRGLTQRLGVADLRGFGCEEHGPSLVAAWALLEYAQSNTRQEIPHLQGLRPYSSAGFMVLDAATRRNLELFQPMMGSGRKGTLLGLLDLTSTAMGGRTLREWLSYPLLDIAQIRARQTRVALFVDEGPLRRRVRELLKEVADLERLAGKLAQRTASPRDLVRLRLSLETLPALAQALQPWPELAQTLPADRAADVAALVATWIVDEPPLSLTEGGILREGVDPALDELLRLSRDGKSALAQMESEERQRSGIQSLKIRFNQVSGYYIEITRANLHKVPDDYLRKATLSTGERFITPALKEFEEKILHADERSRSLEYERFTALREQLGPRVPALQALARAVATLDATAALAEVAVRYRYVRPQLELSLNLEIDGGRHPVVEQIDLGERFVPNDLRMAPQGRRLIILTGPNMSGKSTVMRQAALIALMAQIGSFVPADRAVVGLCDRIFTRVGASDDLASGRSTFMVEMSETANILHSATERSLVILDEIGRGTSTYDGLAIAWAVAEALHDKVRCRALFATHYHELVSLADSRRDVANVSVAVSEWGDKIVFLRRLKEGGASRSYGIQCARLAGMPPPVITRARSLLVQLEQHAQAAPTPQLGLFDSRPAAAAAPSDPIREQLAQIDPDELSPREAHALLVHLKGLAAG